MNRPAKQSTSGSGGRDSAISFESASSGRAPSARTTSPPSMGNDRGGSIASRASMEALEETDSFGIPTGAQVLATRDGEACFLVDLSRSQSPAAIKERIYARLGIYDDDQALYRISRARAGHPVGGFLDDWKLWDLCMRIGPDSDPPMLMALVATSADGHRAASIASPKSAEATPLSAGARGALQSPSESRASHASPDQGSIGNRGSGMLSAPTDDHRDRAGSLTPTAPPSGLRSPTDEAPSRPSTDSGTSSEYFTGGFADPRTRYHRDQYHPPSGGQGSSHTRRPSEPTRGSQPMSAVDRQAPPASAYPMEPSVSNGARHVPLTAPSSTPASYVAAFPVPTAPPGLPRKMTLEPPQMRRLSPQNHKSMDDMRAHYTASEAGHRPYANPPPGYPGGGPPLQPLARADGMSRGYYDPRDPRGPSPQPPPPHSSRHPPPGRILPAQPSLQQLRQPAPQQGRPPPPQQSGQYPPQMGSGRPGGGPVPFSSPQPSRVGPNILYAGGGGGPSPQPPQGQWMDPRQSQVGPPPTSSPMGRGPSGGNAPHLAHRSASVGYDPHHRYAQAPLAVPRPREREAPPRPPSTYESGVGVHAPYPPLHAPSAPPFHHPHGGRPPPPGWEATSLNLQQSFQRTPIPVQPGQTLQDAVSRERERHHRPQYAPPAATHAAPPPGPPGAARMGHSSPHLGAAPLAKEDRPDYVIPGATYHHPPAPAPVDRLDREKVSPSAQRIQKTASQAESTRSSTSSSYNSSTAASPSRPHPTSSLRDSAGPLDAKSAPSIRSSQGSELLTPATTEQSPASANFPVKSILGIEEEAQNRQRAGSVASFRSARSGTDDRPHSMERREDDPSDRDDGSGTARAGDTEGDSWSKDIRAFVNRFGMESSGPGQGDGTIKPTPGSAKDGQVGEHVRFSLPEGSPTTPASASTAAEIKMPKPAFDFEEDEDDIPSGTFMTPMRPTGSNPGGKARPMLTLDTAPPADAAAAATKSKAPPKSSSSGSSSKAHLRASAVEATGGSGGSGSSAKASPIHRRTSFAKREADWAFRPDVDQVYENLEEFFPEHDLDKPIDIGSVPADLANPGSPSGSSSAGATTPSPVRATLPATPAMSRLKGRARSIRVVAQERKRWMSKTEEKAKRARTGEAGAPTASSQGGPAATAASKGARAAGSGALLRRKSTKLWGAKIEEVTPGQQIDIPSTVAEKVDVDPDNFSFKWVKGELIGKGSFGHVYLALNATTGEMLAVKQVSLPKTISDRDDERQSQVVTALKGEIGLMRDLEHGNIVQYLGFEETTAYLSIFLEYVPGGSIGRCLRKHGPFEYPVIQFFTLQVLEGLRYLHSQNILHRDLKADNLLVDLSGVVKISDFGISKRVDNIWEDNPNMSIQGSIFWMAPEVVYNPSKRGYNAKVDIWSLGCVVLEMFAGRRPWSDDEAMQAVFKLGAERSRPPVPPDVRLDKMSSHFLDQCFMINPEARPTADRLLDHRFLELPPEWNFEQSKLFRANKHPR